MAFNLDRVKDLKTKKFSGSGRPRGDKKFRPAFYRPNEFGESTKKGFILIPPVVRANNELGYETFPTSMPGMWHLHMEHSKGMGNSYRTITCLKTWGEKSCPTCDSVLEIFDGERNKHMYPREKGRLWCYPVEVRENSRGELVAVPIGQIGFFEASYPWFRDKFLSTLEIEDLDNKNDVLEKLPMWFIKAEKTSDKKWNYTVGHKRVKPVNIFAQLSRFCVDEKGEWYLGDRDSEDCVFKTEDDLEKFILDTAPADYTYRPKEEDLIEFYAGYTRAKFEEESEADRPPQRDAGSKKKPRREEVEEDHSGDRVPRDFRHPKKVPF
jgi:hypothetical protein